MDPLTHRPSRLVIVTGGQSGVDRAALDVASQLAIPYTGFCPRGGWAEDFPEPPGLLARYPLLRETPLADPAQRTEWNVRDSDAVLILTDRSSLAASPGTTLAHALAARDGKPLMVLALDQMDAAAHAARWLDDILAARTPDAPLRLGIGGPRESEASGIYAKALAFLQGVLRGR
jgi:Circularly permutated YpsA SLOG family